MENNVENIIKCNSGWKKLYQPIIDEIVAHDTLLPIDNRIGVVEIKSVNGTMDIKLGNAKNTPLSIRRMVTDARIASIDTCEFCGSKTEVGYTTRGEIKTCCEKCFNLKVNLNGTLTWIKKRKF